MRHLDISPVVIRVYEPPVEIDIQRRGAREPHREAVALGHVRDVISPVHEVAAESHENLRRAPHRGGFDLDLEIPGQDPTAAHSRRRYLCSRDFYLLNFEFVDHQITVAVELA